MNAVYCSLPVVADDVTGSKEIDVFLSTLLQRTEKGIQCLILVLYLLGNPGVKRRVGKERVFHEKDRRIGMLAADEWYRIYRHAPLICSTVALGTKSRTNMEASTPAMTSAISRSSKALPLNPRLMHSRLSQRSRILVCTMPGREAQPPCKMLVP